MAAAIDCNCNCIKRNSFIVASACACSNLPPTGVYGGAPLKVKKLLVTSRLMLKTSSSICPLPASLLTKLSSKCCISYRRCGYSTSGIIIWNIWNLTWFRCFIVPWSWTSRVISIYLLCLNFVVEVHDTYASSGYDCENVQKYYAGMEHLRGEALKRRLNFTIARHQSLPYKKVWDALKILDAADVDNPEASSQVVEIYSLRVVPKLLAGKPEGWNREHLWPRSYGLTDGPSLSDLHNIRPADVNVNSSRGNKLYGECRVRTSNCLKPASKESASDTETDKERWAPPVQVRGDIARAVMYMAVCYGFNRSGGLDLHLSDSPSIECNDGERPSKK
ncbi:uncharacterized protein LOC127793065 isoform X2 [Diospyros lotus]|uniref:uncharacterized protein LOC127793065 isoform X2 n=1 Tax=Diospyros lotus TaxID=55363 RepID=UPI00225AC6F8|nr:uncharacterized protein LOC127793065 isoform X2 [Diospyros lotus]